MKNLSKIFVLFVLLSISSVDNSYAQAEVANGYNPLSLRQVHESYLMWKKTLWRRVDMDEKQNKPFFARNREISKIIIDAVERGVLIPYTTDSVDIIMDRDVFLNSLEIKVDKTCFPDENGCNFSGCPGEPFFEECPDEKNIPIDVRDFSIFQIKEDLYFDRIHSRIYFDIQSITMFWDAGAMSNNLGVDVAVASFRFIDLHNLFKSMPKEAIWFNEKNVAQHKNLADAFLLRLFRGYITKMTNADGETLLDIYARGSAGQGKGIMAAVQAELDLMEWESNLWEY